MESFIVMPATWTVRTSRSVSVPNILKGNLHSVMESYKQLQTITTINSNVLRVFFPKLTISYIFLGTYDPKH